jgi:hypothetical protein
LLGSLALLSGLLVPQAVLAAALSMVEVTAPAVNCVFSPSCTVSGHDTVGTFALPGMAGLARLQSRTLTSSAGAGGRTVRVANTG